MCLVVTLGTRKVVQRLQFPGWVWVLFFNVYTTNKQLFMWDHGNEDKEPARESNILPQAVSLQSLLGWVRFDAGKIGAQVEKHPASKSIVGFEVLKSP